MLFYWDGGRLRYLILGGSLVVRGEMDGLLSLLGRPGRTRLVLRQAKCEGKLGGGGGGGGARESRGWRPKRPTIIIYVCVCVRARARARVCVCVCVSYT